jgi:hypothetical protein
MHDTTLTTDIQSHIQKHAIATCPYLDDIRVHFLECSNPGHVDTSEHGKLERILLRHRKGLCDLVEDIQDHVFSCPSS